jgi:hypothetical protein
LRRHRRIIEEGKSLLKEDIDKSALDACLKAAGQRAEHYEMVAYGSLIAWARAMEEDEAADLLEQNLEEKKVADEKLAALAEGGINEEAASAARDREGGHEEDEEKLTSSRGKAASSSGGRSKSVKQARAGADVHYKCASRNKSASVQAVSHAVRGRAAALPAIHQRSDVRSAVECTAGVLLGHGQQRDWRDPSRPTGSTSDIQRRRGESPRKFRELLRESQELERGFKRASKPSPVSSRLSRVIYKPLLQPLLYIGQFRCGQERCGVELAFNVLFPPFAVRLPRSGGTKPEIGF